MKDRAIEYVYCDAGVNQGYQRLQIYPVSFSFIVLDYGSEGKDNDVM